MDNTRSGTTRVLYVAADVEAARGVAARLESERGGLSVVPSGPENVVDRIGAVECIVCEQSLDETTGLDVLRSLRDRSAVPPFVLVAEDGSETLASRAISAGVAEYVPADGDWIARLASRLPDLAADHRREDGGASPTNPRPPESEYADGGVTREFRTLVEQNPDALFVTREGRIVFHNARVAELTGYDPDELDGMEVLEMVHPDDRPTVESLGERHARGEDVSTVRDVRISRADGETRECRVSLETITFGGRRAILGSARDVTERRERERQLQQERDEYASELDEIFDRVTDAFFALDEEWEFTYVNERAEELIGHTEDELLGETIWDMYPGTIGTAFEEAYHEAMEEQHPVAFEEYYPPLDTWFAVRAYPSETGVSVYFQDITERKERERELEQYERIVETIRDGVYALNADEEFIMVNDEFVEMTGYDREELLGKKASEIHGPDKTDEIEQLTAEVERGEREVGVVKHDIVTAAGETLPIETRFTHYEFPDGQGRAGVCRDISETRKREHRLAALHEVNQDLSHAETEERIADALVEAATDILDLTGVAVFLHDDASDTLEPVAQTGSLDEPYRSIPAVDASASQSVVSSAYLSGETTVHEDVAPLASHMYSGAHLRRGLFVPLGDHGILVAGDVNAGSFEESTVDLAELLAANAESEFDRLERETALRDRETELRRRVEQQNIVTQLGQQALEGDDVDALMQRACRLVAETLGNEYCKVLDLDPSGEELLLRAGVGWDEGYVGTATVGTERDSQAGYTLLSDEPVVVEDMENESRFSGPDLLLEHGVVSGISTIIGPVDDPWGVIGTHDTSTREYTEHDVAFLQNVANVLASTIDRRSQERELETTATSFRNLYDVASDPDLSFEEKRDRLLDLGRRRLDLANGFISRIENGTQTIEASQATHDLLQEGEACPLDQAYCRKTIESDDQLVVENAFEEGWEDDPGYQLFELESYIGAKIEVGGDLYGTLCFADTAPRDEPFSEAERAFVDLLTQWLSYELDRRAHEAELKQAERQLEASFNNPVSFMAMLEPDGTIMRVNETACEFADIEPADVAGEKFWATPWWDHSTELQRKLQSWISRASEGEFVQFEEDHRNDGRVVTIDGTIAPVRDDEGNVVELLASGQDVTERKERERELREQREQLSLLNHLNEVVRDVNQALAQQSTREEIERVVCERLAESDSYEFAWIGTVDETGEITPEESVNDQGYLDSVTITTDRSETGRGPSGQAARTGEIEVVQDVSTSPQYEQWREQARKRGFTASAAIPITYEDNFYGLLNVYTDRNDAFDREEQEVVSQLGEIMGLAITAVEREEELRENERRYRTLAENVPNGAVTLLDTDLEYQTVAGTIYDELDIGPDDLEGRKVTELDFLGQAHRETLESSMREALSGEAVDVEFEFDDRVFNFHTLPVRDEDGTITGVMTLSQDITQLKEREQQLQHERERLEFINRLIRHNLLNSLNVVLARAGILERHVDPEGQQHLGTVQERTEEMVDLIETLRSLMRVIVEEEEHELEPVDLESVLRSEIRQAREAFDRADFTIDWDPDGHVRVMADDLLEEVFENLLVNAVQHNDKEVPEVTIEVTVDEDWITVEVVDNGPGIPQDMRDRIFEKGEKGFESPGTGFGLHLVREIIDAYDGDIRVANNDGEGAVFTLSLPRA